MHIFKSHGLHHAWGVAAARAPARLFSGPSA
jgi:hypothetical protein